ncbi:MAG: hypothetical protein V1793_23855 [Pseudomonadota bacterium]
MIDNRTKDGEEMPECFGNLEKVFPVTDRGLRETPDDCMYFCAHKTPCLRKALAGDQGEEVEEELIERSEKSGMISFFERWSRKKKLHRERRF